MACLETLICDMFNVEETALVWTTWSLLPPAPKPAALIYFQDTLISPLNPELNPICCLLALLGANHFLHVSGIRIKSLTLTYLLTYSMEQSPS